MNTTNSLSSTSLLYNRGGYSIKNDSVAISANRFQMLKSALVKLMLVVAIVIGGKVAWGEEHTVTWTATSGALGTGIGSGTISTGTFSWNYTRTLISGVSYTGFNTSCIQLGKNGGVENITFRTSNIPGTIKSVSVECSSYQGKHNVSISVGGTSYLASTATASWTTVSAKTGTGSSSGEIVISFTGGTRALYIKSIMVVYETGAAVPYTVTFIAGTGSCDYSSIQESPAGSGVILPAAVPLDDCSSYTFYGWSTDEVVTETSSVPIIVGKNGDSYFPTEDIELYAVYKKVRNTYSEKAYDFSEISFNNWTSSYTEHTVRYDVADVIFESASKQTGIITDIPVTKGNDVFLVLHDPDCHIKQVSFVCRQWNTNTQAITLHYSADGGSTYTSTGTTSTNFSISNNSLNANTNAVKLTFSNLSNQIGIESCSIKVRDIIYNSNPLCNSATITYDANGATTGTAPIDPNSPYTLVNGQKNIELLYNTGNLAKNGYTFDGWNTEFDGSGISYSEGTTFTLTDNIVLYAKWNPNVYSITWYSNGAAIESLPIYQGNSLLDESNDIADLDGDADDNACDGMHFVGWYESEFEEFDGTPTLLQSDDIARAIATDNKNYYAVFANVSETAVRWILVTDEENLAAGDSVIIVASEDNYAMSKTQNNNNRGQNSITKSGSEITLNSGVCVFEIQNGLADGTLAFYDANYNEGNGGYLYAASSNNNYLRTEEELDINGNGNWTISIDEGTGVATITAQGSNSRNLLRYNSNSSIFSCYGSGQKDVSIYKKTGGTTYSNHTTFCPCNYDIENISNGDMVWAGKNGPTNEWNLASNWVVYRSSDSKYHLTNEAPTSGNVFIKRVNDGGGCIINVKPHLTSDVTCNNIKLDGIGIDIADNQTLTINGTATFTNGVINGNVTFGPSATVSGVSASSHVDGLVTKSGEANGFTFPTGSNGNLGKVEVTDGTATNVSVQYFSNPAGFSTNDLPRWWNAADMSGENPFNHVSNVEYWKISSNEAITADFVAEASTDMHFNSETAEEDRIPANIQMAFYDNNHWTNVGGTASISDNTLTITGAEIPASATRGISGNYTTFGSKSKSTVLPIELVSFTANCNGRSALIEWTTATEKNNDYFVLERSHDAVNFKEIARIAGAGNSIEPISYAYTDFGVRNGDNYYRLVQFDYDGTSTASEIIVANCLGTDGEPEVLAYPNPFGDDLTLRFENFGNIQATVEVYDMLGRMVHTQKVNCSQNDYEVVLRLAGLSDGTYNVRISAKEFVLNRQVIKN